MTENDLIIWLAKVDGKEVKPEIQGDKVQWTQLFHVGWEDIKKPDYLTSRDTIVKVLPKLRASNQFFSVLFQRALVRRQWKISPSRPDPDVHLGSQYAQAFIEVEAIDIAWAAWEALEQYKKDIGPIRPA